MLCHSVEVSRTSMDGLIMNSIPEIIHDSLDSDPSIFVLFQFCDKGQFFITQLFFHHMLSLATGADRPPEAGQNLCSKRMAALFSYPLINYS